MTDMLEDIFKRQKGLDDIIRNTKKSQGFDFGFNESEWIDRLTTAMIAEALELKEESNWKWWKKPKEIDKDAIRDEMADILHFWVSLCLKLGISPHDIYRAYIEKNEENRKRQQKGY
jgi:dimeric dUTPase (all-alpha-NTP-PPase superfamily)